MLMVRTTKLLSKRTMTYDDDSYTNDDDDNVSLTTMSNKKRKYDIITSSDDGDTSKSEMAKLYPHLLQALGGVDDGFDPTDPSVRRSIEYPMLEFLVPKAILPSATKKNDLTPPSKSPAPNTGEHSNRLPNHQPHHPILP